MPEGARPSLLGPHDRPLVRSEYNVCWEFPFSINGVPADMVFTSVTGHLMELAFGAAHRGWRSCNPSTLFEANVNKLVPEVLQPPYAYADSRRRRKTNIHKCPLCLYYLYTIKKKRASVHLRLCLSGQYE